MTNSNNILLPCAMRGGLSLGIFWIIKYLFFMFGSGSMLLYSIYYILTPFTLVFAYYLTRSFRELEGGRISFLQAWGFGILLYFFAALIVSIAHYTYYAYVAPPGLLEETWESAKNMLLTMNSSSEMVEAINQRGVPTPISMTFYHIGSNVMWGVLFSIPVAIAAKLTANPIQSNNNQSENKE
ncbi:MAG: DUF4199 domain-containing protein [Tannerellaceae bacterium]|nr:DUF4199 domain-containing protein [Tannerellaceae bacterium]